MISIVLSLASHETSCYALLRDLTLQIRREGRPRGCHVRRRRTYALRCALMKAWRPGGIQGNIFST
jgi:hypothetical protein